MPSDDLSIIIKRINKILETIIVKVQIVMEGVSLNVFDEKYRELMTLSYGSEEIFIDIDLLLKEIIMIRAFGLEVRSRESQYGLEVLARKILDNIRDIKELHNIE
jgi:hypothetical protein